MASHYAAQIDAYVIFGDTEYRNVMLDGEIIRTLARDYYAFKVDKLNQISSTYADKSEPVVKNA